MRRLASLLTKGQGGAGNGTGNRRRKSGPIVIRRMQDCLPTQVDAGGPKGKRDLRMSSRRLDRVEERRAEVGNSAVLLDVKAMPVFPALLRGAKESDLQ